MVRYNVNLKANAKASFRTRLAAVALSGSLAVATADGIPQGSQPYGS